MRGSTTEYAGLSAKGKSFHALQTARGIARGDKRPRLSDLRDLPQDREDTPDDGIFNRAYRLHRHSWRGRLAIRFMVWAVRLHSGAVTAIMIDLARKTPLERVLAARLS